MAHLGGVQPDRRSQIAVQVAADGREIGRRKQEELHPISARVAGQHVMPRRRLVRASALWPNVVPVDV